MSIKVVVAEAQKGQLADVDLQHEVESVCEEMNRASMEYMQGTVNAVFIKGIYNHVDRRMVTAIAFVNKMNQPIEELHGVLRFKFENRDALIAKTTLNFDKEYMGTLNTDDALLVHIGIPVKNLKRDEIFTFSDITGRFDDVRVTFATS